MGGDRISTPSGDSERLAVLGAPLLDAATMIVLMREPRDQAVPQQSDRDSAERLERIVRTQLGTRPPSMLTELGSAVGLRGLGHKAARRQSERVSAHAARALLQGGSDLEGGWSELSALVSSEASALHEGQIPNGATEALGLLLVKSTLCLWALRALPSATPEMLHSVVSDRSAPRRLRSVALRRGQTLADGAPRPYLESVAELALTDSPAAAMVLVAADFDLGRLETLDGISPPK